MSKFLENIIVISSGDVVLVLGEIRFTFIYVLGTTLQSTNYVWVTNLQFRLTTWVRFYFSVIHIDFRVGLCLRVGIVLGLNFLTGMLFQPGSTYYFLLLGKITVYLVNDARLSLSRAFSLPIFVDRHSKTHLKIKNTWALLLKFLYLHLSDGSIPAYNLFIFPLLYWMICANLCVCILLYPEI